ncbi:hypothetical protein, partial [Escherichia coli]|uniref:hypothetical protein n=1 Tax=Escherichia coli TaxID=562 RepID=UPI0013B41188
YYPEEVYEAPKPVAVPTNAWTIRTKVLENASGKQKKTFTIVNQQGAVAASDLNIIEAAQSLQKYLNKGLPVNHPKVQEVLELEESYVRNRQEALRFKQLHERSVKVNET